jgi:hypothetical protein
MADELYYFTVLGLEEVKTTIGRDTLGITFRARFLNSARFNRTGCSLPFAVDYANGLFGVITVGP